MPNHIDEPASKKPSRWRIGKMEASDRGSVAPYDSSIKHLRSVLFGQALASSQSGHQKLPKILALPIFSSDALSSVAYATEAILGVLITASTGALGQSIPIGAAICTLILVVALSYRQIIFAYPHGGGAYPVGKENLGDSPALIAGAALLIDYILTVAVSVASGIDAIGSFSSSDILWLQHVGFWVHAHTVDVCIACTIFIMFANLRGVRESGAVFAIPAYAFILGFTVLIIAGITGIYVTHSIVPPTTHQMVTIARAHSMPIGVTLAGWYLVLQAFSSGCSALTGMEAISNTTPFFQKPEDKNAAATMSWMAGIAIFFFFGITYLARVVHALPIDSKADDYQTVISQIAHVVFDNTHFAWFYYFVQMSTAIILILAANTAFAGFPQLASMLAKDNYLPRQLASVGDRLVFANGIVILAGVSCALLVVFQGDVYELIPLYAVGVFTSFTIAQSGMVKRWVTQRGKGWKTGTIINGLGAIVTAAVALIFVVSKWASGVVINPKLKFSTDGVIDISRGHLTIYALNVYRAWQHTHHGQSLPGITIGPDLTPHYGAWIVAVLIPVCVLGFRKIAAHYRQYERQLALVNFVPVHPKRHVVLVLVPRLHRGVVNSLIYAQSISPDARAVYVEINEASTAPLKEAWEEWSQGIPLIVLASPYRSLVGPLVNYIKAVQHEGANETVTVILPEFVSTRWWHTLLHNHAGLILKLRLATRPGIVVSNVRYFFEGAGQ
ncbi:MAG: APC family permease [Capsulimonadaceae bacterium]|nr:APC family permease [Capsulimonadaceae bacterium]